MTPKEFLETFYEEPLHIADIFEMEEVVNVMETYAKTKIDAYKECFEQFIPVDKWDEATRFLSTYKDGLAEDFEKKEDSINHKKRL